MAKKYTYPRVTITTNAKRHSMTTVEPVDNTILFQPIKAAKGPVDRAVKVRSYSEFVKTFGEIDYATQKQAGLNIRNWLQSGGTGLVYRLIDSSATKAGISKTEYKLASFSSKTIYEHNEYDVVIRFENDKQLILVDKCAPGVKTGTTMISIAVDAKTAGATATVVTPGYVINGQAQQQVNKTFAIDKDGIVLVPAGLDGITITCNGKEITFKSNKTEKVAISESLTVDEDITLTAKYPGALYNGIDIEISKYGSSRYTLTVKKDAETYETYGPAVAENIVTMVNTTSEYITGLTTEIVSSVEEAVILTLINGSDGNKGQLDLMKIFWAAVPVSDKDITVNEILGKRLETPVDIILDAAYPVEIKEAIANFTSTSSASEEARPDIMFIFDDQDEYSKTDMEDVGGDTEITPFQDNTNIARYAQRFLIKDADIAGNIWVSPTYFLASKIPVNDSENGLQFALAGTTRGHIDDLNMNVVVRIDTVLGSSTKEQYFKDRINYVEKDSRGYHFMSQRTYDGSTDDNYTALSFINNRRCLNKMIRELETRGRDYLFEFNDAVTLSNMSNELNRYIGEWISNRTLNYGIVEVAQSPYSETAVDINLRIRFTGTIEVIDIGITIE